MDRQTNKSIDQFISYLPHLQAVEFIGLANLLCVPTATKIADKPPKEWPVRDAQDIIEDVILRFATLGRKQRRDILKLLKESTTTPLPAETNDGTSAEDR